MQFIRDNDFYKVARITEPKHNFLAIKLSEIDCQTLVTPLPIKDGEVSRLDGEEILKFVRSGLAQINAELDAKYFVAEVQFAPSDTEPESIYEMLTRELIMRIHSNSGFRAT